jgi:hypothetical protein
MKREGWLVNLLKLPSKLKSKEKRIDRRGRVRVRLNSCNRLPLTALIYHEVTKEEKKRKTYFIALIKWEAEGGSR